MCCFGVTDFPQCFVEATSTCDGAYHNSQHFRGTILSLRTTLDSTALNLTQTACLHILNVASEIHSITSERLDNGYKLYIFINN